MGDNQGGLPVVSPGSHTKFVHKSWSNKGVPQGRNRMGIFRGRFPRVHSMCVHPNCVAKICPQVGPSGGDPQGVHPRWVPKARFPLGLSPNWCPSSMLHKEGPRKSLPKRVAKRLVPLLGHRIGFYQRCPPRLVHNLGSQMDFPRRGIPQPGLETFVPKGRSPRWSTKGGPPIGVDEAGFPKGVPQRVVAVGDRTSGATQEWVQCGLPHRSFKSGVLQVWPPIVVPKGAHPRVVNEGASPNGGTTRMIPQGALHRVSPIFGPKWVFHVVCPESVPIWVVHNGWTPMRVMKGGLHEGNTRVVFEGVSTKGVPERGSHNGSTKWGSPKLFPQGGSPKGSPTTGTTILGPQIVPRWGSKIGFPKEDPARWNRREVRQVGPRGGLQYRSRPWGGLKGIRKMRFLQGGPQG